MAAEVTTGDEVGRTGQHAFTGAKNFALDNANFKSAGRNMTIYENCNIVGGQIVVPDIRIDESRPQEETKLFRWVVDGLMKSNVNFKSTHSDALSKRTTGTGLWFMQTDEYSRWTAKTNGLEVLWGNGMPGAGKTVLSSIIIDHLQKEYSAQARVGVIFAYCRYTEFYSATQIYTSWIKDLLEQNPPCFLNVRETFALFQKQEIRPTQAETLDLLCSICCAFEKVYIVLDGLDEATEEVRQELLEGLATFPRKVHTLIMSRPLPLFKYLVPDAVFLDIEARNEDIELFVDKRIHQIPRLRMLLQGKEDIKKKVYSQIKEKSGGMFLVASLQIEAIKGSINVKSLLKCLDTLPTGVDDLYRGTLDRINAQGEEEADLAKRAILWIINVFELLSVEQLQHALAVSLDSETFDVDDVVRREFIVAVCCGLVIVDQASQKVRLIHYTASDFLKTQCPSWFATPHTLLASSCVVYISNFRLQEENISDNLELNYTLEKQPLLPYAYAHWGQHARQSSQETDGLSEIVSKFVLEASNYPWIAKIHGKDYFDLLEPEHIATVYGLTELLQTLPDGSKVTPKHKFTLLHMAAIAGHIEVSRHIMEKYPSLSLNDQSAEGSTPIILAAASNHEDMVESFLSLRTSQPIKINVRLKCECTALSLAVEGNNKKIVTLLLSQDEIDINARCCQSGTTPLMWAARHGHASVAKRLLSDPAIDINVVDSSNTTPLMEACTTENVHVVKLLLAQKDLKVNAGRPCGCNPLVLSAKSGSLHVVSLLTTHPDINIHARCGTFGSAISAPEGPTADAVLKLLLSSKNLAANATEVDTNLMFHRAAKLGLATVVSGLISALQKVEKPIKEVAPGALIEAARLGHATIVRMLLQHTDINGQDDDGKTGLSAAAEAGRLDIVELFLARKDILINSGKNCALINASKGGHVSIVKRLLRYRGVDVNMLSEDEETPIAVAAKEGHWGVVDLLLTQSAIRVGDGSSSPLIYACSKGSEGTVEKLLARDDVDVNKEDKDGWPAITHAASQGHIAIYRLLATVTETKVDGGRPPLVEAAGSGYEVIVQALLARPDANPNLVDTLGWTALGKAAASGNEKIMEMLLAHTGIDVNAGKPSPLIQASKEGKTNAVKILLLRENIDVNTADSESGGTAISIACQKGYQEIAQLLLDQAAVDLNVESSCGCNALGLALKGKFPDIAALILSCGKPVNPNAICKEEGCSPLHAASSEFPPVVPLLLAMPDIDVNAKRTDGESALALASRDNRPDAVIRLLARSDLDIKSFSHLALISAAGRGNMEIVKTLVAQCHAIDVNQADDNGLTALSTACSNGQLEVVTHLLSLPKIDLDCGRSHPLLAAAGQGHQEIVELLLSNGGVDVNKQDEVGYTALAEVCHNNQASVIPLLLAHADINVNCGKYPPLTVAARFGRTAFVYKLLRHPGIEVNLEDWGGLVGVGAPRSHCSPTCVICFPKIPKRDVAEPNRTTALGYAVAASDVEMTTLLLAQPNIDGSLETAFNLMLSSYFSNEILDLFLAHEGINVNVKDKVGDPALIYCIKDSGKNEVAEKKLLPRDDIDINAASSCGCTPLIWACINGRANLVDILLGRPELDVTPRCPVHGYSAILSAAGMKQYNIVRKLIDSPHGENLDFNETTKAAESLLALISNSRDEELVRTILSRTIEPAARNAALHSNGRTALMIVLDFGDDSLFNLVLSSPEINVNHKDKKGDTALTLAVRLGREEAVRALLLSSTNINVNTRNAQGESALSLAAWYGHTTIARLLLSRVDIDITVLEDRGGCAFLDSLHAPSGEAENMDVCIPQGQEELPFERSIPPSEEVEGLAKSLSAVQIN